ncbi:hypothetical protein [Novosphingobium sp. NBM11]|uniref:hypothetical protein n=1 Tax=Novosphingobium sp. NBM11 TaxID=2596914 RepID=UPI0019D60F8D|nr:hypothetical protein [Novosphingobium sp. NBM11]
MTIRDKLAKIKPARIARKAAGKVAGAARDETASDTKNAGPSIPGPSTNAMTNLILADIALRAGGALLRRGVERGLLGNKTGTAKAKKIIRGRTMGETLIGTALARVATRSVPGAIMVGGGLLAKTLYDRRHGKSAKAEGEAAVDAKAKKGAKE